MKKVIVLIFILLMVLFSVSGCRSASQKIAEKIVEEAVEKAAESEGEDVEVDLGEGEVTIKTDEGEVTIGEGAGLPDGFPGEVPVHSDLQIATSFRDTSDEKANFSVSGSYPGSGEDLFGWYKDKLSGWNVENEFSVDMGDEGKSFNLVASNDKYEVAVLIVESEDEGTALILTVSEK